MGSDEDGRGEAGEAKALEIDSKIEQFLDKRRGIDQPFYLTDLVEAVGDPTFDDRVAHQALDQLVAAGRVERQRRGGSDEYWPI